MKTIILAAGKGKRLEPLTAEWTDGKGMHKMSKPMIPIANKPMLEWIVDSIDIFSDEIFIVVRDDQLDIINHFKKYSKCKIVYQKEPLGTAHAVGCCEKYLKNYDGKILKLNGDDLISKEDVDKFSRLEGCHAAGFYVENSSNLGYFQIKDGFIEKIEEKPEKPVTGFGSCGMFLFDKRIFDYINKTTLSKRGEYELTDTINMFLKDEKFKLFEIKRWSTITYPWDLLDVHKLVLDQYGTKIDNNVEIRPGVYIEYPVAIGEGSVIGPNCFIRKYSTIGRNCHVGNAVEIKNSIIMDNSHVAHLTYVGDSIIGRNCNIGAGTMIANLRFDNKNVKTKIKGEIIDSGRRKLGTVIGDNVKFGVNVTVMPGKKIWPNLMIPACMKVEEDIETQPELRKRKDNGE